MSKPDLEIYKRKRFKDETFGLLKSCKIGDIYLNCYKHIRGNISVQTRLETPNNSDRLDFLKCVQIIIFFKTQICTLYIFVQ